MEKPGKDERLKWPEPPKKGEKDDWRKSDGDKPEYKAKTAPPRDMPKDKKMTQPKTPVSVVPVLLEITPVEASIYLDGKFWGIAPPSGKIENMRLRTGKYSLEVVKPGYLPYLKKLDIKDKKVKLIIKLEKI